MKTVSLIGNNFKITFPYDPATVAQVRCLPQGRRWDPVTHAWWCPPSVNALTQLREYGFEVDQSVQRWEREFYKPAKPNTVAAVTNIPGLKGKLYPFQAEGVGFIESRGGRALLGDEMGLGKTIQALAWLQNNPNALPAVVVCPASLKGMWETECKKWTMFTPVLLHGMVPFLLHSASQKNIIYIINYDILSGWLPALALCKTVILDEVHYCKSAKTKRTKAVKRFCKNKSHVIALSGTPIVNRPSEFFIALNILAPATFPKWWDFAQRYCDAKHNGFGWDTSGASNVEELHTRAETVMLRRLKADVLKDLPEKQRSVVPLSLNGKQAVYDAVLAHVLGAWRNEEEKPDPLRDITQISHLRQAVMDAKFDACVEWINCFVETGKKLVIFDIFHKTTDRLMERYNKIAVALDGRVDSRLRSKVIDKFQNDPSVQILIGNIQVAGIGFTLTAASDVVFLELPWTPAEVDQSSDRVHRIGQRNAVTIYFLIAPNTMEEDILTLLDEKRKVLNAVLDGKITGEEMSIYPELLRRLKNKRK